MRSRQPHDYEVFCELLQRILDASRRWGNASWYQACARQLAITVGGNLNRRDEAIEVLDAAAAEWGDPATLQDQRATFAFEHGDYANALNVRGTLDALAGDDVDFQPATSTRNAAVSAMHVG